MTPEELQENKEPSKGTFQPKEPLKIQGAPPALLPLAILLLFGFGLAAGLFFFLTHKGGVKAPSGKGVSKKEGVAPLVPPLPPIVEVIPPSGVETAAAVSPSQESKQERPLPALTLSGILFGEEGSLALINGRVVKEGGIIEGARLQKVYGDKVELIFDDKRIVLRAR